MLTIRVAESEEKVVKMVLGDVCSAGSVSNTELSIGPPNDMHIVVQLAEQFPA